MSNADWKFSSCTFFRGRYEGDTRADKVRSLRKYAVVGWSAARTEKELLAAYPNATVKQHRLPPSLSSATAGTGGVVQTNSPHNAPSSATQSPAMSPSVASKRGGSQETSFAIAASAMEAGTDHHGGNSSGPVGGHIPPPTIHLQRSVATTVTAPPGHDHPLGGGVGGIDGFGGSSGVAMTESLNSSLTLPPATSASGSGVLNPRNKHVDFSLSSGDAAAAVACAISGAGCNASATTATTGGSAAVGVGSGLPSMNSSATTTTQQQPPASILKNMRRTPPSNVTSHLSKVAIQQQLQAGFGSPAHSAGSDGCEACCGHPYALPSTFRFYIIEKSSLRIKRAQEDAGLHLYELCPNGTGCEVPNCPNVHIKSGDKQHPILHDISPPMAVDTSLSPSAGAASQQLIASGTDRMWVENNGVFSIELKDVNERTVGLCISTFLNDTVSFKKSGFPTGVFRSIVCKKYLRNACHRGETCLYIHTDAEPQVFADDFDTKLSDILKRAFKTKDIDALLTELQIQTLGELQSISKEVYEVMVDRYSENSRFSHMLANFSSLREFPMDLELELAVKMFIPLKKEDSQLLHNMKIDELLDWSDKDFVSQPWPPKLLHVCGEIRRRSDDSGPMYTQIDLTRIPADAFLAEKTRLICGFRSHAHKSWTKQDDKRPIVTSLITYIDPSVHCECKGNPLTGTHPQTPKLGAVSATDASSSHRPPTTPNLGSGGGGAANSEGGAGGASGSSGGSSASRRKNEYATTHIPWAGHWCKCERKHFLALNYELSTPSGSRCSEQNCLGMLASQGIPTSRIREVFVHGGNNEKKDTNPLFPCGVCENMLRRVAKDVDKETSGGPVLLFMFEKEQDPKKIVCMPVVEMSHRDGSMFRKFVEQDLKVEED